MGFFKLIGRYFVQGILALLPLMLTFAVLAWLLNFINEFLGPDTWVGRGLARLGGTYAETKNDMLGYMFGWFIVISIIILFGVLLDFGIRRIIHGWIDAIMTRVPLVGTIYKTAVQLVQMVDKSGDKEMKQMRTVYCDFNEGKGLVLLALMPSSDRYVINGNDYHAVLIPTAPVPFGGALFFVPCDCVKDAAMSVDAFMNIYVSMGVSAPQFMPLNPHGPAILDPNTISKIQNADDSDTESDNTSAPKNPKD